MSKYLKITYLILFLSFTYQSQAAQMINLKEVKIDALKTFVNLPKAAANDNSPTLKETNRYQDFNHITHVRFQEYYRNYPVWHAQAVLHVPQAEGKKPLFQLLTQNLNNKTTNGTLYQQMHEDLLPTENIALDPKQIDVALTKTKDHYLSSTQQPKNVVIKKEKKSIVIFIDKKGKANWAYFIQFDIPSRIKGSGPAKPSYIIDAVTLKIYQYWNDRKTIQADTYVQGGGFGGNTKTGRLIYDGLSTHLDNFKVKRDNGVCYLQNEDITIYHYQTEEVMHYPCLLTDPTHNNIYWSADFDKLDNNSYSPANDAMFAGKKTLQFYKEWYLVPALINPDGSEMKLNMYIHQPNEVNAAWDDEENKIVVGDGDDRLHALTALGIIAHEISHGFTDQHSNLAYYGQSGGMNESFSDMAAQVAEYFVYGKSSWQIGGELIDLDGESLRYMDLPSKDCYGNQPGALCSIDKASEYDDALDVHDSSGVYNHLFYILSTQPDWNPRKAFAVFLHANASYWLAGTQFVDGAACVMQAASDLHYDTKAIKDSFKAVGIDATDHCTNRHQ